jgi:hypothetical protein
MLLFFMFNVIHKLQQSIRKEKKTVRSSQYHHTAILGVVCTTYARQGWEGWEIQRRFPMGYTTQGP